MDTRRVTLLLRWSRAVPGAGAGASAVEGQVECEDGTLRPFSGWLGLVNELERVVSEAP